MNNMDDLDNLMDNFDVKTFWEKKKLGTILGIYLLQNAVVGIWLIKSVLDASRAGAIPKGMDLMEQPGPNVIR